MLDSDPASSGAAGLGGRKLGRNHPQRAQARRANAKYREKHELVVQVVDLEGEIRAENVIDLAQTRSGVGCGPDGETFCTNLSTRIVGGVLRCIEVVLQLVRSLIIAPSNS
jgi:hypothetical protein